MADMLVKLYEVAPDHALTTRLENQQISIRRALSPDKRRVIDFIDRSAESHWPQEPKESWLSECEVALTRQPPTCFLAIHQRSVVGFACYDATAKGFFGPMGVLIDQQGKGVGKALLIASLLAMWNDGYGYALIGWPARQAVGFYAKTVNAQVIEDSTPGIYGRLIKS
jgi:hypothetical protein